MASDAVFDFRDEHHHLDKYHNLLRTLANNTLSWSRQYTQEAKENPSSHLTSFVILTRTKNRIVRKIDARATREEQMVRISGPRL